MSYWLKRLAILAAIISCGFTMYFGWTTGGDDRFAKVFNGAAGGVISIAVPLFFFLCGVAENRGRRAACYIFAGFGFLFGVLDASSNVGSLFAMREGSIIRATHTTQVAKDKRAIVASLKKKQAELQKTIAFWPVEAYGVRKPSAAYNSEIETQQRAVDLEASRGGCKDQCIKKKRLLDKLISAQQLAAQREAAQKELAETTKALQGAMALSESAPPVVSPVEVIKSKLGSVFSGFDLKPGEDIREITYLVITFVFGFGLTVLSGALGYGATWIGGHRLDEAPTAYEPPPVALAAPAYAEPQSLSETTYNISVEGSTPSVDRLMDLARQLDAKRRTA